MQRQVLIQMIMIVLVTIMAFSLTNAQQPKTVTDFYLAIPSQNYSHPYDKEVKGKAAQSQNIVNL